MNTLQKIQHLFYLAQRWERVVAIRQTRCDPLEVGHPEWTKLFRALKHPRRLREEAMRLAGGFRNKYLVGYERFFFQHRTIEVVAETKDMARLIATETLRTDSEVRMETIKVLKKVRQ